MLHELLLALGGCPGSIFIRKSNKQIKLVEQLPFIHPTEAALLDRLCQLATHYTNFKDFTRKYGHSVANKSQSGLYLKALCLGLEEVLKPYRQALLKLEKELLEDPYLTPAYIQGILEQYQVLFPSLWHVLDHIQQQGIQGCHVLDVLHKSAGCGIPSYTAALNTLFIHVHQVLYKQLAGWILHGMLLDPYQEFFIHKAPASSTLSSEPSEGEEDDVVLLGVTGRQMLQAMKLDSTSSSSNTSSLFAYFSLRLEMLPSYIPVRVAEKILFVGESVQMFRDDRAGSKTTKSIFERKEDEFGGKIHALSELPCFDIMQFEEVIDEIRIYVAEQLWRLVVEESQLESQLRKVKDFYLLGRGELFLTFIDQAHNLLCTPPTATTQYDVNMSFQQAARQVLLQDESVMQHLSLTVLMPDSKNISATSTMTSSAAAGGEDWHMAPLTGWDNLNLSYAVQWPLHILFNPQALDRYNTLFRFLLYVKRTQLALQGVWAAWMRRRRQPNHPQPPIQHTWLHNHMSFLIDNLQYYLQVDVIESQYTQLLTRVNETRDFEAVRTAHDTFLAALLSHTFLLMKPISRCLMEIMELCHRFCGVRSQPDEDIGDCQEKAVQEITLGFQRQTGLLFQMLSSVRSHQASPHLAQLLLRIDFNKYLTLAGGKLGSIAIPSSTEQGAAANY